ncbi:kinase UbiB [Gracilariopsis chorda]|uniref:Kinase UbiB n=1 Tax=Gracilariopsis chorda TaxID=448386 RepID=A0A2V3IYC7_9FLOR|nr:kinase UbiB [Gracilariopsis chorda]|eukprot:PXF47144.1 kinase UbiB [Gracilariopsis chorda]
MALFAAAKLLGRTSLLAAGATASSLVAAEYAGSDAGVVRSFTFWRHVVPMYAHYKLVEWRVATESDPHAVAAAYRPLHERYSPRVRQLALHLQGFYFKLAQIMSTRDDFLPDEYLQWTKQLQDQCPNVMPSSEAKRIVERSLDVPFDTLFAHWDDQPIGAASVAQVHRARLRESGELVAVKVLFPGMESKFTNDIQTVEVFCKYLMPQNASYFAEIKRQFATEFDATREARNLQLVHHNICATPWGRLVQVPRPLLSSKHVLVMSYLEGPKLVDGVRQWFKRVADSRGMDFDQMEREQKRLLQSGQLRMKEVRQSANETARIQRMIRLRDMLVNALIFVGNYTVRPLLGGDKWKYCKSEMPLNLGHVMDVLLRVHAHEIFMDGAFNGDPHPGNILLMPDGRLGLVDYGQVKRMSLEDRIVYAKLIVALNRDDRDEVVRIMSDEIGFRTKYMKKDIIYRTAAFFNCRDSDDITLGMNVSAFMEWLQRSDPVVRINDEFVMVGRVSVLLRGMANAFGLKLRVSDYWKEEAEMLLKSQGIKY